MVSNGIETEIAKLPQCDYCKQAGIPREAGYDGKTRQGFWAYMCEMHFWEHGIGLGSGKGQKLKIK